MHYCYLLKCVSKKNPQFVKSYIGYTNNLERRLNMHNCIIKGGAKNTKGYNCEFDKIIQGFRTKGEALSFEYLFKNFKLDKKRIDVIDLLLNLEEYRHLSYIIIQL